MAGNDKSKGKGKVKKKVNEKTKRRHRERQRRREDTENKPQSNYQCTISTEWPTEFVTALGLTVEQITKQHRFQLGPEGTMELKPEFKDRAQEFDITIAFSKNQEAGSKLFDARKIGLLYPQESVYKEHYVDVNNDNQPPQLQGNMGAHSRKRIKKDSTRLFILSSQIKSPPQLVNMLWIKVPDAITTAKASRASGSRVFDHHKPDEPSLKRKSSSSSTSTREDIPESKKAKKAKEVAFGKEDEISTFKKEPANSEDDFEGDVPPEFRRQDRFHMDNLPNEKPPPAGQGDIKSVRKSILRGGKQITQNYGAQEVNLLPSVVITRISEGVKYFSRKGEGLAGSSRKQPKAANQPSTSQKRHEDILEITDCDEKESDEEDLAVIKCRDEVSNACTIKKQNDIKLQQSLKELLESAQRTVDISKESETATQRAFISNKKLAEVKISRKHARAMNVMKQKYEREISEIQNQSKVIKSECDYKLAEMKLECASNVEAIEAQCNDRERASDTAWQEKLDTQERNIGIVLKQQLETYERECHQKLETQERAWQRVVETLKQDLHDITKKAVDNALAKQV
jgi:hypothetical protein